MPDKTPQGCIAATRPPGAWFSDKAIGSRLGLFPGFPICASISVYRFFAVPTGLDSSLVPYPGCPCCASIAVYPSRAVPTSGTVGVSRVLRHFSSHMPRPEDSGGPSIPLPCRVSLVLPSVHVKTLGVRNKLISKLYQHFRVRVTPTAYGILCLRLARLVRGLHGHSATDPRLDTGGGLALTRQGLSPCKKCRALLGAITQSSAAER